ncbi:Single-stranded DNA-binding protein, mitochondrial [Blomia tropicalis]|nr:Single-stranded DNA-binding protein, mitochondrial [Blomia tropicalis]
MFRALTTRFPKSLVSIKVEAPSIPQLASIRQLSNDSEEHSPLENVDTFKCINRVTLLGRAVGPATSVIINDSELALFTLATNEIRRNRSNELVKRTEFHKIQVFFPRLVSKTKQVVQKGSRILVEGKINYNVRKYESGNAHFTNIIAENIVFFTGTRVTQEDDLNEDVNADAVAENELKQ